MHPADLFDSLTSGADRLEIVCPDSEGAKALFALLEHEREELLASPGANPARALRAYGAHVQLFGTSILITPRVPDVRNPLANRATAQPDFASRH